MKAIRNKGRDWKAALYKEAEECGELRVKLMDMEYERLVVPILDLSREDAIKYMEERKDVHTMALLR